MAFSSTIAGLPVRPPRHLRSASLSTSTPGPTSYASGSTSLNMPAWPSAPLPPHLPRARPPAAVAAPVVGGFNKGNTAAWPQVPPAASGPLGTVSSAGAAAVGRLPRSSLPAVVVKVVSDASSHVLCESQPPRDVRMCGNALAGLLAAASGAGATAPLQAPGAKSSASGQQQHQLSVSPGTLLLCVEAAPTLASAPASSAETGAWGGGPLLAPAPAPPLSCASTADASALPPSTALLSSLASGLGGGADGGRSLLPGGGSAASTWGHGYGYSCSNLSGCLRPSAGAPPPAAGGGYGLQHSGHAQQQHQQQARASLCPGPGQLGVYVVFAEVLPRGLLELAARELAAVMPVRRSAGPRGPAGRSGGGCTMWMSVHTRGNWPLVGANV